MDGQYGAVTGKTHREVMNIAGNVEDLCFSGPGRKYIANDCINGHTGKRGDPYPDGYKFIHFALQLPENPFNTEKII